MEPSSPPAIISYDDPTRPISMATRQATFQTVYVNLLLIILAILVVIFSIWGYHQLK